MPVVIDAGQRQWQKITKAFKRLADRHIESSTKPLRHSKHVTTGSGASARTPQPEARQLLLSATAPTSVLVAGWLGRLLIIIPRLVARHVRARTGRETDRATFLLREPLLLEDLAFGVQALCGVAHDGGIDDAAIDSLPDPHEVLGSFIHWSRAAPTCMCSFNEHPSAQEQLRARQIWQGQLVIHDREIQSAEEETVFVHGAVDAVHL